MMQPPVLNLQVNANGFNLIRALLGKAPHDEVAPFIAELNAQVTQQIADYNTPKEPPVPGSANAPDVGPAPSTDSGPGVVGSNPEVAAAG